MNTIVKDKMQREILVVACEKLFENIDRETKVYDTQDDFENVILQHYEYMVRWEAEVNFDYKQPIPYAIVLNENNDIFVYKRGGAGSNAWESRLHEKIAIWVGWHIEREDEGSENILKDSLIREVEEELNVSPDMISEAFPVGYINQDTDEVCKVHLWIGYVVKLKTSNFQLLDGELAHGEFKSFDDLMEMIESWDYDVEAWTQMLAPEIKKYI